MSPRLLLGILLPLVAAAVPVAAQSGPADDGDDSIYGCYVRGAGTVYIVKGEGAPDACTASNHVLFEWNEQWDVDAFQRRVAASCTEGSAIRAVSFDGSVECEPDDDSAAGVDFSSFQLRIQPCGDGETIRQVNEDGTVVCQPDRVGDTSALQLRVSGACPVGYAVQAVNEDGSVVCSLDRSGIDGAFAFSSGKVTRGRQVGENNSIRVLDPPRRLGTASNRVCFLTFVRFGEIDSRGEISACNVYVSGGSWYIAARGWDDDNYAQCNATCFHFGQ